MTLEKNYLVADEGKRLHRKETDIIVSDVFLGKYDSVDNWEEITVEEAEAIEEAKAKAEEAKAKAITVESNSL